MNSLKIRKMTISLLFVTLFALSISPTLNVFGELTDGESVNTVKRVIVFSADAFRHDYFEKTDLPTIEWLIGEGAKADYCIPSNPSVTAVNHVSMITGNHPDEHGIIGNTFYDWEDNKSYSLFEEATDPYRDTNTGLHLLNTKPSIIHAEENDIVTAAFGWPYVDDGTLYGCLAPTYLFDFDYLGAENIRTNSGIARKTVETIIAHPEISLSFSWLPGVDSRGHYAGIDSPLLITDLVGIDNALKYVVQRLQEEDMLKETVIILASDHGMATVDDDDYFLEEKSFFELAVNMTGIEPYLAHDSAIELLYFIDETNVTKVEEFATYIEGQTGIQAIYVNEENNDIELFNEERGVNISVFLEPGYCRNFGSSYVGMHGYLNTNTDMHGIFIAAGPGIKQNVSIAGISIIDIAPTALSLLDILSDFETEGTVVSGAIGSRTTEFLNPDLVESSLSLIPIVAFLLFVPIVKIIHKKRK
ncbi:MAG: alkaline phosphatase family protein [Candidatus Heimdallarchaeota archaeon]|nr:alkaline phosphatase family protein [Candidatus Heimdallarchaeota archaeon]